MARRRSNNPRRKRRRNRIKPLVDHSTTIQLDKLAQTYQARRTVRELQEISSLLCRFTKPFPKEVSEEVHLYLLNNWDIRKSSYARYFQKYGFKLLHRFNKTYISAWSKASLKAQGLIPPLVICPFAPFESCLASTRLRPLEKLIVKDWILNDYSLKEISKAYNMSYRSLRELSNQILEILAQELTNEAC